MAGIGFAKVANCIENEAMRAETNPLSTPTVPGWTSFVKRTLVWLAQIVQRLFCAAANLRRRLFSRQLPDYVVLTLDGPLQERDPEQPWYYGWVPGYRQPQSLEGLHHALERIADDPSVRGVLLLFKGVTLSLAQAQSLATLFERFRQRSRKHAHRTPAQRIVVLVETCSPSALVAASTADQLYLVPQGEWDLVGLRVAPLFVKETLARLGIEMQVVRVAPWKTAADSLLFEGLTAEARAQSEWLLDSLYQEIVEQISQGRRLPAHVVQEWIDRAPLTASEALAAGLVDALAYEDELPLLLGSPESPARLKPYRRIQQLLYRFPQPPAAGAIGVLSLTGSILTGESRSFPVALPILGEQTLGSTTAQQLVRAARQESRLAAVIVHVDSPGGSALASDLIWRELALLNTEKPVIVYMGDVAASGGYYLAVAGRKIVAQRATLTGSIGVIAAKANLSDAFARFGARRDEVRRGTHAGIYGDTTLWQGDLLERIEQSVHHTYTTFQARVLAGRQLSPDQLSLLAGGRVWTGAQALQHGLIDALGDFTEAVAVAISEAGLPAGSRCDLIPISLPSRWQPPQPAAGLGGPLGRQTADLATFLLDGELVRLLEREQLWLLAPSRITLGL